MVDIPPAFKNFGKNLNDLFKKQFDFKKSLTVKTSASGSSIETSAETAKNGEFTGNFKATSKVPDVGTLEAELHTSGGQKYSAKVDKLSNNLVVKISGDEKPSSKVEADYSQEYFAASLNLDVDRNTTAIEFAPVTGADRLFVGGSVKYDVSRQQLSDINAGVEYNQDQYTITCKTADQGSKISTGYIHKLNSHSTFGASFLYNIEASKRTLSAVYSHRLDDDTLLKIKGDTNGVVAFGSEQRLKNAKLKFNFAAEFNAKQGSTLPEKVGLGLTFGDD